MRSSKCFSLSSAWSGLHDTLSYLSSLPATHQQADSENSIEQKLSDIHLHKYDLHLKPTNTGHDILSNLKDRMCPKTEIHSQYHSVANLQINDIPGDLDLNAEEVLRFLKLAGPLVVRLCVSYTSERSGRFDIPVLNGCKRYATGWACQPFGNNEGSIKIITARHAVYNNLEAQRTEVTFFFDGPNHSQATVAQGVELEIIEDERDFAILECVPKDKTVRDKLTKALDGLRNGSFRLKSRNLAEDENGIVDQIGDELKEYTIIIISHPHGGSKHVSFGTCKNIEESDAEFDMTSGEKNRAKNVYTYDVATCPGSSGAPVIVIGESGVSYFWTPHCHCCSHSGYGVSTQGLVVWRGHEYR